MKFFGVLLLVVLLAVLGSTSDAQAQGVYTICNSSPVDVVVCLQVDCGGVAIIPAPCPLTLPSGQCFAWTIPAGCMATHIGLGGVMYPVQPWGGIIPVPPHWIVFDPLWPDTAEIQ